MSQDVDSSVKQSGRKSDLAPAQLCPQPRSRTSSNGPFLSKIRNFNHLALHSIGSLFSAQPLAKLGSSTRKGDVEYAGRLGDASWLKEDQPKFHDGSGFCEEAHDPDLTPIGGDYQELHAEDYYSAKPLPVSRYGDSSQLLPASELTNSNRSHAHTSTHLPEFRHWFNSSRSGCEFGELAHGDSENIEFGLDGRINSDSDCKSSATSTSLASNATSLSSPSRDGSFSSTSSQGQWVSLSRGPEPHPGSSTIRTPPLTPDSFNAHTLPSIRLSLERFGHLPSGYDSEDILSGLVRPGDEPTGEDLPASSNLWEIKEGKKPERISEIEGDTALDISYLDTPETVDTNNSVALTEDQDEWYGLEYTLELSSRERRPSETQSFSAGEHSRSRESWAAIHRGRIHPFFEDEDYQQWKNWHRFLDLQDERKKHQKGLAFKARSKDLAWFFVNEIRTWDILYWQKEVYGVVARDVKERLQYITEHRPDPFLPPRKHNRGWYLKRSRSLASLRELNRRESDTGFEEMMNC